MALNADQLADLNERLRVYDVDQHGWEHEGQGLDVNIRHVQHHLTQDLERKNFTDVQTVEVAVEPDCLQYALRIGRWTGATLYEITPSPTHISTVREQRAFMWNNPRYYAGYVLGVATLGRVFHNVDHASSREIATGNVPHFANAAAGYLMPAAHYMSEEFDFDLAHSFDRRLSELRLRFGIPDPTV